MRTQDNKKVHKLYVHSSWSILGLLVKVDSDLRLKWGNVVRVNVAYVGVKQ